MNEESDSPPPRPGDPSPPRDGSPADRLFAPLPGVESPAAAPVEGDAVVPDSEIDTGEPPAASGVDDGRRRSLAPGKLKADKLVHTIQTLIFAGVGVVVGVGRLVAEPDLGALALPVGIGAAALLAYKLAKDAYARAAYRRYSYRVSPSGLEIRRGVCWRSVINIPHSRVQHTDVSRGPLERYFDIATIAIHTAGTSNATVLLPGLEAERALRIRDHLLGTLDDHDAV